MKVCSVFLLAISSLAAPTCRAPDDELSISLLQSQLLLNRPEDLLPANFATAELKESRHRPKGNLQDVIAKAAELKQRAVFDAKQLLEQERQHVHQQKQHLEFEEQLVKGKSEAALPGSHLAAKISDLDEEIQHLEKELDKEEASVSSGSWMQLSVMDRMRAIGKPSGAMRDLLIVLALGIIPLVVILSLNGNSVFFPLAVLLLFCCTLGVLSHVATSAGIAIYLVLAGITTCLFTAFRGYSHYHSRSDEMETPEKVSGRFDKLEGMIKAGFGSALREEDELLSKMRMALQ